jgi:hypothetical protein
MSSRNDTAPPEMARGCRCLNSCDGPAQDVGRGQTRTVAAGTGIYNQSRMAAMLNMAR